MKKKNSIVQLAKLKNKFYLKDKKIKKIYKIFKNILFKHIKNESFCVGVSGGPDSLALAYLSKIYSKEFKAKYRVLIVNHRLRKESTKEAKEVKSILLKQGILSNLGQTELIVMAKKNGFRTMHNMGHDLLLSGDLTYKEYERILPSS